MGRRYEELSVADEVELTTQQLHVLDGLTVAARDPRAVLDLILDSDDVEIAAVALKDRFGLTEVQARAVLDMQFRRVARLDRSKLVERRDELADQLNYLHGLDRPSE